MALVFGAICFVVGLLWAWAHLTIEGPDQERMKRDYGITTGSLSRAYAYVFLSLAAAFVLLHIAVPT